MELLTYESMMPSGVSRAVTFKFSEEVDHHQLAALFRLMVADFPSSAFDLFVINKNTTFDEDNYFVTFLENVLVVTPPPQKKKIGRTYEEVTYPTAEFAISIRGPKLATTDDIMTTERSFGYTVVRNQPLFYVREGEEVDITLFTKISTPRDHTKFRIVEEAAVDPRPGAKTIRVETTALSTPQEVMDWALNQYNTSK